MQRTSFSVAALKLIPLSIAQKTRVLTHKRALLQYIGVGWQRDVTLCLLRERACHSNSSSGQIGLLTRAHEGHAKNYFWAVFFLPNVSGDNCMTAMENYERCMPLAYFVYYVLS
jgi:hypothetical protein